MAPCRDSVLRDGTEACTNSVKHEGDLCDDCGRLRFPTLSNQCLVWKCIAKPGLFEHKNTVRNISLSKWRDVDIEYAKAKLETGEKIYREASGVLYFHGSQNRYDVLWRGTENRTENVKEYRQTHKVQITEGKKEYRETHKPQLTMYQKMNQKKYRAKKQMKHAAFVFAWLRKHGKGRVLTINACKKIAKGLRASMQPIIFTRPRNGVRRFNFRLPFKAPAYIGITGQATVSMKDLRFNTGI